MYDYHHCGFNHPLQLAAGAVSEAFPHIFLLHGRQQGTRLAVTLGWDGWGRGAWLNEAGHQLCLAWTCWSVTNSCYKSLPSSWSGLLSTKKPLTSTEMKLKIGVSNLSECVCFGEELEHSSLCILTLGQGGGGLSFYCSTIQKLVTIETLCIFCYINARQTDLFTDFLPFSSGWHKGREQTGREMDGSDVGSQSCAFPKHMHNLILQTACLTSLLHLSSSVCSELYRYFCQFLPPDMQPAK